MDTRDALTRFKQELSYNGRKATIFEMKHQGLDSADDRSTLRAVTVLTNIMLQSGDEAAPVKLNLLPLIIKLTKLATVCQTMAREDLHRELQVVFKVYVDAQALFDSIADVTDEQINSELRDILANA